MKDNPEIFKRVKINWGIIFMLTGMFVLLIIPTYIYQFGTNPVDEKGLVIMAMFIIVFLLFHGRHRLIIDNNFVVFRLNWDLLPVKVPIDIIKEVAVSKLSIIWALEFNERNIKKYQFDYFIEQAVSIQLKNGKHYKIAIKNAQKIKEEIEKRMLTTNKTSIA